MQNQNTPAAPLRAIPLDTPESPAQALGLSPCHTSTLLLNLPTVTWAKGGYFVRLTGPAMLRQWQPEVSTAHQLSCPRGPIVKLSRKAARRLMQFVSELNWQRENFRPLFLTLTYPRPAPTDAPTIKGQLKALWMRLQRKWPHAGAVVVLECQCDGTPHFHLVVFGVAFMPWRWLASAWDDIIGNDVTPEKSASTQVQRVRSRKGTMSYLRKYLAKAEDQGEAAWGKRWTLLGKENLPRVVVEAALDIIQFHRLRRWLRAFRESQGRRFGNRPGNARSGMSAFMSGQAFERMMGAASGP